MNPVVHFEMPYDDPARLSKFYKAAFGWKNKMLGKEMGDYVLATTTASGPDGTPKEPGMINGGFFRRNPDLPGQLPSVVIAVNDIKKAMAKVTQAGGEVHGEPMDIPGIGAFVSIMDTEGNRLGILEPLPMMKAENKKAAAGKKKAPVKKKAAGGKTRR